jgi:hypothetical protein
MRQLHITAQTTTFALLIENYCAHSIFFPGSKCVFHSAKNNGVVCAHVTCSLRAVGKMNIGDFNNL